MTVELSFCVVNQDQRELLRRCLDAIERERAVLAFETETLVIDNASTDGSTELAREHGTVTELIAHERRLGKAENDSLLLARARGRYCLLLNGDSELLDGATLALYEALERHSNTATAGAALLDPEGKRQPSAWRFPTVSSALAGAFFLHRRCNVQSRGERVRVVEWAQSAALLVSKRAAEEVGYLDPQFFVYSDEVDFCRRLADASWKTLYVPAARAVHHEQLVRGSVPERRIVEFSRNRDLYMRKHHGGVAALVVRLLTAWTYALRAVVAPLRPGHDAARYRRHVTATLFPKRGEGLREAAEQFNRAHPPCRDRA